MAIPKYDELMKPLLEVLADGDVHPLKQIKPMIVEKLHIPEAELSERLASGRQTFFDNRISWARTYLVKAGLLTSVAKASYIITEAGRKVVLEQPPVIDKNYLMRFPSPRQPSCPHSL